MFLVQKYYNNNTATTTTNNNNLVIGYAFIFFSIQQPCGQLSVDLVAVF